MEQKNIGLNTYVRPMFFVGKWRMISRYFPEKIPVTSLFYFILLISCSIIKSWQDHLGRRQNMLPQLRLTKGDSRLCASRKRKEFLCDGRSIVLRMSAGMTCQDTPLTWKHLGDLVSVSPAGTEGSRLKNRQSLRLPDQSHRQDISMRTKRPNFHSSVDSVALFTPMGLIPDAGPLQSKFFVSQWTVRIKNISGIW